MAERSEYTSSSQKRSFISSFISYLLELRNLSVNWERLSTETILLMKRSNIVLGSRRVKKSDGNASNEGDEDDWELQDELLQAKQVVIVDDTSAYQLFGDRIFCAPQESMLEGTWSTSSVFHALLICC